MTAREAPYCSHADGFCRGAHGLECNEVEEAAWEATRDAAYMDDDMPEEERVREYNNSCPPNAAWELAADYCRALGIEATERRGDFFADLAKHTEDRRWRLHYGVLSKFYYDAAADERHRDAIRHAEEDAA